MRAKATLSIPLLLLLGCSRPPQIESTCGALSSPVQVATAPAPSSDYQPGQAVDVHFQGTWYPGRIVQVIAQDRWEVSYDGYSEDWNRLVGPAQIRPHVEGQSSTARAADPPGRPIRSASELQRGMPVMILYGSTWYPGQIIESTQEGGALISYDGYGSASDEAVSLDRLCYRPPGAEQGTPAEPSCPQFGSLGELQRGTPVMIRYGSTWYPGHVIETTQEGRVLVSYDGYGEGWNEAVDLHGLCHRS